VVRFAADILNAGNGCLFGKAYESDAVSRLIAASDVGKGWPFRAEMTS
jgi:hypothetical protein